MCNQTGTDVSQYLLFATPDLAFPVHTDTVLHGDGWCGSAVEAFLGQKRSLWSTSAR